MTKTSYVLSFTAGGLLFHESIVLAEELVRADFDWDLALNAVKAENLLQSRTQSTAARKLREVRKRLRLLTVDQISLIAEGIRLEQKLTLWLACCRRYQLLADFARDVVRSKYEQLDLQLSRSDIQQFIDNKTIWHEELENLAATTRTKLETVMLRMLRESEMLSEEGVLLPPLFTQRFSQVIRDDSNDYFFLFPAPIPE